jgi:hypothetical protein
LPNICYRPKQEKLFSFERSSYFVLFAQFLAVSFFTHVSVAVMPLAWLAGILPPLEPFLLWVGEQALMHAFGGSATASTARDDDDDSTKCPSHV